MTYLHLYKYDDCSFIRMATAEEAAESKKARSWKTLQAGVFQWDKAECAKAAAGVITVEIDGQSVECYVIEEGEA